MSRSAHTRKKDPAGVRRSLLEHTLKLAAQQSLASVTLDAVARAAEVTKGGLLHHFPSKHALIEAAFDELVQRLDQHIDALMAADPEPVGRFTRAYVESLFVEPDDAAGDPWVALSPSMLGDPTLQRRWAAWLRGRLERQGDDERDVRLEVVRLAADGVWMTLMMSAASFPIDYPAVRAELLAATRIRPRRAARSTR